MTALVTSHLPLVAGAQDGIKKLRALILELAVRGKLVAQDASDTTADSLLADIRVRLQEKSNSARTRKSLISAPVDVDEWPFILPSSWRWARFSEITSYVQRGKGPIYADRSQYPVISQKCVRWTGLDLSQARHIEPSSIDRYEEVRHLVKGDILWNSTGTGTIGRACVVKTTVPGQVLVADSHVTVVRCEGVVPEYLWRWIQTPTVQDQIENSASGSTNQVELNTSTVLAHLAPIPPLAEQHRIVAKVDELMALCDRLEADQADAKAAHAQLVQALLDSLNQATDVADFRASWQRLSEHFHTLFTTEASIDALKQTVLQLAVMGKLVPQSPLDEPASDLLVRTRNATAKAAKASSGGTPLPVNLPFELPCGWAWARFNDLIAPEFPIAYGVLVPGPDSADGVPFVRIADLDLVAPKPLPEKRISPEVDAQFARTKLRGGEILMGVVGSIGKLGLAPASWAGANIARAVCRIVPTSAVSTPYVLWLLQTQFMRQQFLGDTRTLAQPTLNVGLIRDALTPVPPLAEQHRIVAKVDELMALCDQLKAQLAEARQQHAQLATALVEQSVA